MWIELLLLDVCVSGMMLVVMVVVVLLFELLGVWLRFYGLWYVLNSLGFVYGIWLILDVLVLLNMFRFVVWLCVIIGELLVGMK